MNILLRIFKKFGNLDSENNLTTQKSREIFEEGVLYINELVDKYNLLN